MNFSELIHKVLQSGLKVEFDFKVEGITYDSRKVEPGFIFFAIRGYKQDGKEFIQDAVAKGAKAVFTESEDIIELSEKYSGVNLITSFNIRKVMSRISDEFFGNPGKKLKLIGVTGTNGKTTIVSLIKHILDNNGSKCGLLGTVDYELGNVKKSSSLTTPDSVEINQMLCEMVNVGLEFCAMEVSSIALVLDRVYGLNFSTAVFTNLSSEHLDLHKNMENYFNAKKILFDNLSSHSIAISNSDDEYGKRILNETEAEKMFYSMNSESNLRAFNEKISIDGLKFEVKFKNKKYIVESLLTGRFNIYNILAALSVSINLGIELENAIKAIKTFKAVNGRFNKINLPNGAFAVIDYSHTSDSLKNAIEAAIEIREKQKVKGKVITIFGCGGNKDRTKRPVMGNLATSLSDYSIITSDNPRFENPMEIISEILSGVKTKGNFEVEENRELAIKKGIEISSNSDIILICGKGHETYQEINGVKSHFDDKEIVEKYSILVKI
ncbi:MAG TPA: UDP-N-acetylmuramoyl-L-alanyl-D-glutamate--2,6-diaminopimelate ligase [Ignavibacteria bacterium]